MTTEGKIKAIKTWTNKFEIVHGDRRWYAKVQYREGTLMHSTMYFNYDQMVNSTYNMLAMRIWGLIVNAMGKGS